MPTTTASTTVAAVYAQDQVALTPHLAGRRRPALRPASTSTSTNNRTAHDFASDDGLVSPRAGPDRTSRSSRCRSTAATASSYLPRAGEQLVVAVADQPGARPRGVQELRSRREVGRRVPALAFTAAAVSAGPRQRRRARSRRPDAARSWSTRSAPRASSSALSGNVTRAVERRRAAMPIRTARSRSSISATARAGRDAGAAAEALVLALEPVRLLTPQWGAGLGVIYRGDDASPSTDNTVVLPRFTRVDAARVLQPDAASCGRR